MFPFTALSALFLTATAVGEGSNPDRPVDFNKDVRPLLSDRCYACHGPDEAKRKGGLRLDRKESALEERKGRRAIVPGDIEASEVLKRIATDDPRKKMPPPKSGKALSAEEVATVRRWIAEGAGWKAHWAYSPPSRSEPPAVKDAAWPRETLDRFVLARLEKEALRPSPAADPITLIRRLSLDLTGLPPEPEEVDRFAAAADPERAYRELVERLLGSPHFGERLALYWLDLVRYADTTGIHGDNHREVAPYRDWVIRSFNENKRFDRFTIEQLAGDLLPGAGVEEKVGSGYNRMLMTTNEGGAQAGEYIAKYAADRVRNASSVWLGATLGCAECHDHKFDPYTTRDFYRFAAFFADLKEAVPSEPGPPFPVPTPEQAARLAALDERIAAAAKVLETSTPELEAARAAWESEAAQRASFAPKLDPWHSIGPFPAASFEEAHAASHPPEKEIDLAKVYPGDLRWKPRPQYEDGKVHALRGDIACTYLFRAIHAREEGPATLLLGSDDGLKVWLGGELLLDRKVNRAAAPDQEKLAVNLKAGENRLLIKVSNGGGTFGFAFRVEGSSLPDPVVAALRKPAAERSEAERAALAAHHRSITPLLDPARKGLEALKKEKEALEKEVPRTLVSMSSPPRKVKVLPRGNWLDGSGEEVEPGAPAFLPPITVPSAGDGAATRPTRLDLARWIVSRENPLTARVLANRLWMLLFGAGICRTPDDLGSQGAPPSHPELLDGLAVELVESGWDVKGLVRRMVLSSTYRQSSRAPAALRERDPYNVLLARQASFRLEGELVRDAALAASGVLVRAVGGRSVRPYQPAGYWAHLNFPTREYQPDQGEALWRRGLYTYWCRTFLHPSLLAFDAPGREECTVARTRSNTPLQALTLLNDPIFVEAARVFAERILKEGGAETEGRIRWAFRRAAARSPRSEEVAVLKALLEKHLAEYRADPTAAEEIRKVGQKPRADGLHPAEAAAWTSVARAILNLHETITRS